MPATAATATGFSPSTNSPSMYTTLISLLLESDTKLQVAELDHLPMPFQSGLDANLIRTSRRRRWPSGAVCTLISRAPLNRVFPAQRTKSSFPSYVVRAGSLTKGSRVCRTESDGYSEGDVPGPHLKVAEPSQNSRQLRVEKARPDTHSL